MDAKFGYITNYPLSKNIVGYQVRSWNDFKNYHIFKNAAYDYTESTNLIAGYVKYLSKVCNLFEPQEMQLASLTSLHHSNEILKKIINSLEGYTTKINNGAKSFDAYRSGYYFFVSQKNSITIQPWFGIYYAEKLLIYIEINESGSKRVYDTLPARTIDDGKFYEDADFDSDYGNSFCFYLKKDALLQLHKPETTVSQQEAILENFISEVLAVIDLATFTQEVIGETTDSKCYAVINISISFFSPFGLID